MATVGGVSTSIVFGEPSALKPRVNSWIVPGMDGVGAHVIGSNQGSFAYLLVNYGTAGAVETWLRAIDALCGTVISVVDEHSVTRNNLLAMETSGHKKKTVISDAGNTRGEVRISGVVSS